MTPQHDLPVAGRAGHATPDEAALRALAEGAIAKTEARWQRDAVIDDGMVRPSVKVTLDPYDLRDLLATLADLRARLAAAERYERIHIGNLDELRDMLSGVLSFLGEGPGRPSMTPDEWGKALRHGFNMHFTVLEGLRDNALAREKAAEQALAAVTAELRELRGEYESYMERDAVAGQTIRDYQQLWQAEKVSLAAVTAERDEWKGHAFQMAADETARRAELHDARADKATAEQQRDTAQARVTALDDIVNGLIPTLVVLAHDEGRYALAPELHRAIQDAVTALSSLAAAPREDACAHAPGTTGPAGQALRAAALDDQRARDVTPRRDA